MMQTFTMAKGEVHAGILPLCRHCGHGLHIVMADLGTSPPSNAFKASDKEKEKHYPLRVLVCDKCWLAQTDIGLFELGYDELFTEDYPYRSSMSTTFVAHARKFVEMISEKLHLGPDSLSVEIGANDGYLLQWFKTPCYGVEPTRMAVNANIRGLNMEQRFFTSKWAEMMVSGKCSKSGYGIPGKADLMICNNVLAHVPDINDFVKGFAIMLKPTGIASFEFPHLLNLVRGNQFDTIYHEHYSYLSLTAVTRIFAQNGLTVFDVEELPTHGGSLRVYAAPQAANRPISLSVGRMLDKEIDAGMWTREFYEGFQAKIDDVKNEFLDFLLRARNMRLKVAAFGAAAKGNTLLNYAGIHSDLIAYVVDETPSKQGKFLPGSNIPVKASFDDKPDFVVILPWNFRAEILQKLAYMRAWGTKFVFAIPRLEIA